MLPSYTRHTSSRVEFSEERECRSTEIVADPITPKVIKNPWSHFGHSSRKGIPAKTLF